jgi:hypothetical protein
MSAPGERQPANGDGAAERQAGETSNASQPADVTVRPSAPAQGVGEVSSTQGEESSPVVHDAGVSAAEAQQVFDEDTVVIQMTSRDLLELQAGMAAIDAEGGYPYGGLLGDERMESPHPAVEGRGTREATPARVCDVPQPALQHLSEGSVPPTVNAESSGRAMTPVPSCAVPPVALQQGAGAVELPPVSVGPAAPGEEMDTSEQAVATQAALAPLAASGGTLVGDVSGLTLTESPCSAPLAVHAVIGAAEKDGENAVQQAVVPTTSASSPPRFRIGPTSPHDVQAAEEENAVVKDEEERAPRKVEPADAETADRVARQVKLLQKGKDWLCPCGKAAKGEASYMQHVLPCLQQVRWVCPAYLCDKTSSKEGDIVQHLHILSTGTETKEGKGTASQLANTGHFASRGKMLRCARAACCQMAGS